MNSVDDQLFKRRDVIAQVVCVFLRREFLHNQPNAFRLQLFLNTAQVRRAFGPKLHDAHQRSIGLYSFVQSLCVALALVVFADVPAAPEHLAKLTGPVCDDALQVTSTLIIWNVQHCSVGIRRIDQFGHERVRVSREIGQR